MWQVSSAALPETAIDPDLDAAPLALLASQEPRGVALFAIRTTVVASITYSPVPTTMVTLTPLGNNAPTVSIGTVALPPQGVSVIISGNSSPVTYNASTGELQGLTGAQVTLVTQSGEVIPIQVSSSGTLPIAGFAPPAIATGAMASIPWTGSAPSIVTLGTQVFTPSLGSLPGLLQFVYNPYIQSILLFTTTPWITTASIQVPRIVSDLYVDASLFPRWLVDLAPEGELELNREFEQHPSGQFVFRVRYDALLRAIDYLRPGKELTLFGVGLRINRLSIVEERATTSANRMAVVTVELGGKWENYVEPVPAYDLFDFQRLPTATIQSLAARSEVPLVAPEIEIELPKYDVAIPEVDWVSELQQRIRNYRCFVFWSNPEAVITPSLLTTPQWILTENEILSDVSTTYPVVSRKTPLVSESIPQPRIVNGTLPNHPLPFPVPELQHEPDWGFPGKYTGQLLTLEKPFQEERDTPLKWIEKDSARAVVVSGDVSPPHIRSNPELPRNEVIDLSSTTVQPPDREDTALNFDASGPTKSRVTQYIEDGVVVREVTEIFGYAFLANQTEDLLGGWRKVEHRDTRHIYRGVYKVGSTTTGWRLVRYRVESPRLETVDLSGSELDEYRYFQVPIYDNQNFVLAQFGDYYPFNDEGFYEIIVDSQGRPHVDINPNFVRPLFPLIEAQGSYAAAVRPNSDEPPLRAGLEQTTIRYQVPKTPYFQPWTIDFEKLPAEERQSLQDQEFICVHENVYSSQDADFYASASQSQASVQKGRPSEADRWPDRYIKEEARVGQSEDDTSARQYYITCNYSGQSKGSISFPGATNLSEAYAAAWSNLYIEALREGQSDTFETLFNPDMKEGDLMVYTVNGIIRRRRIMRISHRIRFLGVVESKVVCEAKTSLTVARDYDVPPIWMQSKRDVAPQFKVTITLPAFHVGNIVDGGLPVYPPGGYQRY